MQCKIIAIYTRDKKILIQTRKDVFFVNKYGFREVGSFRKGG